MDERQRFLNLIRQDPEDDLPRLVYADWLEERGDPRGELIRVQCEQARLDSRDVARRELLNRREVELLALYEDEWNRPFHEFQIRWVKYHRGFAREASLTNASRRTENPCTLAERWERLMVQEPALTRLELFLYRDFNEIQPLTQAPQLRALHLTHQSLQRRDVSQLLRWPIVETLSVLDLSHNDLRSGVECVANSPAVQTLEQLDLSFNRIGSRGAGALANSPFLQNVKQLYLRGNRIRGGCKQKQKLRDVFGPRVQL